MLKRTEKKTRYIFATLLLGIIAYSIYFVLSQPESIPVKNQFFKDISFFQSHAKPDEKAAVIFVVNWQQEMKKSTVENKDNFIVEQVKPDGKDWLAVENGKKCNINHIQYVYAPWVDTEEKRKKASPPERDKKITQLFVDISPQENINDYFRVTVKNTESKSGEKMLSPEFGVIKITQFNKFIKM